MAEIEYIDSSHTYLLDGVIVPSVSELVSYAMGNPYRFVDPEVLAKASDYGTRVHAEIERMWQGEDLKEDDENIKEALAKWEDMIVSHEIQIDRMEGIVYTEDYAGRFDALGMVDGEPALIDFKTNSKLPLTHLSYQLALYRRAIGEPELKCYCAWLPKNGKGGLYPIAPVSEERIDTLIRAYKQNKPFSEAIQEQNMQIYSPEEIVKISAFYDLKEEVEQIEKRGRAKALEWMKAKGVKSFENVFFRITYIAPTKRQTVDTDKMKRDGIYTKYTKEVPVAEGVRITWRQ